MAQARSCGGPWAQNFALFFPLSRSHFRVFSSLSGGSSRGILVVFWSAGTLRCARFCPRGCRVKAPRRPAGQQPTTNNQQQTTNNHTTTNNHHTPHTLSHTTTHRHKPHTPHTQQHTTHTNTIAPTRSGPKSVGPNSVIAVISASVAQRVQLHPSRSPPHVSTDALTRPLRPCLTSVTASSSAVLSCEPESRRPVTNRSRTARIQYLSAPKPAVASYALFTMSLGSCSPEKAGQPPPPGELRPVPVRSVNTSGHGLCGARNPSGHGEAARHDSALSRRHRRVRSCPPHVDDVQCWTFRVSRNCSPSCGRHIPNRHGTHGKTVKARGIGFGSTKVESKVTPSCRSSSVWRSTTLLLRCVGTCARENSCSHTSMTCKSFQSQTAPAHFTSCCLTDCTPWQGIQLQTGKTLTWNAAGECPPGWPSWGPMCGARVE